MYTFTTTKLKSTKFNSHQYFWLYGTVFIANLYIIEGDIIRECDLMTKGVERWLIRTH